MVKLLLLFFLVYASVCGADIHKSTKSQELMQKIESFLDKKTFEQNRAFIDVIFEPESAYFYKDRLNSLKIVETLKENGLLRLFFESPRDFQINFKTSGYPLFFVKIMGDTLRNIGYYRYVTIASHLNAKEFNWSINLQSEYATDPMVLHNELKESGCKIVDIQRNAKYEWTYTIDMGQGYLNIPQLHEGEEFVLKRSLYAHWLDVSTLSELEIKSSRRNQWYPYIAYYDASLHLLKVIKEKDTHRTILLEIPKNAKYMKISDVYTLKNVKDALVLLPRGSK